MPRRHSEDLDALVRYAAGACSPAEARAVEARLAESPRLREAVDGLNLWIAEQRSALHSDEIDATAALAVVRARVGERARTGRAWSRPLPAERWPAGRRNIRRIMVVAASAALMFGAGWTLSRGRLWPGAAPSTTQYTDYITRRGELRRLTLSDGTRVTLAADSRLRVPRFDAGRRVVQLAGEGYFEVAHDSTRPFHVRSARAETTVLGTEFDVKAYPEDTVATVVVRKGKVAVTAAAAPGRRTILTRGMRAVVIGVRVEVAAADPARSLAWAYGDLTFVDEPVGEVLKSVARWYDVRVEADAALTDRRVEVSFANTSFDAALEALAVALHARVIRVDGLYRLEAVAR